MKYVAFKDDSGRRYEQERRTGGGESVVESERNRCLKVCERSKTETETRRDEMRQDETRRDKKRRGETRRGPRQKKISGEALPNIILYGQELKNEGVHHHIIAEVKNIFILFIY